MQLSQLCKRHIVWLILSFFTLTMPSISLADGDLEVLPQAKNLLTLGQQAQKQNIPIVILFSAKGLNSTENLKNEALYPALMSGQFDGYALFREIEVNSNMTTIDFYGEQIENETFKQLYNLTSLPVLLFFDAEGNEIQQPLLSGAYDYYFFYLKASVNKALKALDNQKQIE